MLLLNITNAAADHLHSLNTFLDTSLSFQIIYHQESRALSQKVKLTSTLALIGVYNTPDQQPHLPAFQGSCNPISPLTQLDQYQRTMNSNEMTNNNID